ncbi:Peptidoglycan-associated lipoprotein precursor [Marinomonas spartinae]|uniref:Peptidoglycan-associated lipoprotein n=1 Tax=Marinomonas spartinae TaxID=1792290 RepID=A0A1A8TKJ4_9GAMM|nr:peptidoglycan-associated lipoprotein Pal [Marinomonas spartinae]SBS34060.1 Peptidoglycan-associated lipoprotein precursor [Marinomonas spartinae]SBS37827.1 Peptidoglycan-associated lipoprotein precursor [Marinomonas spartinae]
MSVNKLGKFAVVGLSAAWLAGCSTTGANTDASTATTATNEGSATTEQAAPADTDKSATYGANQDNSVTSVVDNQQDKAKNSKAMLDGVPTVFYFDFDKSIVRPAAREALAKHAQYLIDNPNVHAVLEGNTDERGTREYNMALGERRAKAVARYLTIQGVPASQIETVSFGEEVPVAFGHDEKSWQLNRRVEIRYEK